jgi:hypothetical protein
MTLNRTLWTMQGLLAALFLFAGVDEAGVADRGDAAGFEDRGRSDPFGGCTRVH